MRMTEGLNRILRANETCRLLGISKATLSRIQNGKSPGFPPIPCSRSGRIMLFREGAIFEWLQANENRFRGGAQGQSQPAA